MKKKPSLKFATDKDKAKFSHLLAEGEDIILCFGIGDKYFWLNAISLAPFTLLLIGLPFLWKLVHLKHRLTYILTDRRVLIKDGVLSVKTVSVPYDKITHISVKESFINRISFNIGDITIHTAGPTPIEIDLIKVENPVKIKNLIEELIVKERSLLGVSSKRSPFVKPL